MISHDFVHWPIVLTAARGAMTLADHIDFLDDWNRWFDRGEPFAAFRVFADDDALAHPDGAARAAKTWLQKNSGRMQALVLGMATVVPPAHFDRLSRMDAQKLFGVPARTFADIGEALDWLETAILKPKAIPLDRAAIHASLKTLGQDLGRSRERT